jgi:hypothetical protein
MNINDRYAINIYERYNDLINSGKTEFNNKDLCKIFEYYTCIKLSEEYGKTFYEYDDIDPTFKEENEMSRNDTGIDCCDLIDTIVQCKLRLKVLNWRECGTFFGSRNIFCPVVNKVIIRWDNIMIARNNDCKLSKILREKISLFDDKTFNKDEMIEYCDQLVSLPPTYPMVNETFVLRDYQNESIKMVMESSKNVIINLPTGTGKNSVIIYSMIPGKKYLILVPRIILMEQIKDEIIKHKSQYKNKIQCIGDNNNSYNNKDITICIYNSVELIEDYSVFEKIYIDEAHHIRKPEIYCDEEDVEVANESYIDIIRNLSMYNNNVYLSATIDGIIDFDYYSKDIREMIELKYLVDYQIHVPIFNDIPSDKNICKHLIQNYRNIIIYCGTCKEGKKLNKLMNKICDGCSDYIDCNSKKSDRNNIISRFNNGELGFIINVRILIEGFNSPICKGVCFMHMPSNSTSLIQIIGRSLRLHPGKSMSNIILPLKSIQETNITKFLRIMAQNDSRIMQSYVNKKLGGYISIEPIDMENDDENVLKYNMVYDSVGILSNGCNIWYKKLELVKEYIDENDKLPSHHNEDANIKNLGGWITRQKHNHKMKEKLMSNNEIYDAWTDFINDDLYKEYFDSIENVWYKKLNMVKDFIKINNKIPPHVNDGKISTMLNAWICRQKQIFSLKIRIMKNNEIYDTWSEFVNDDLYKEYFETPEEKWYNLLNMAKEYIITNDKLPSCKDKNKDIKTLGYWIGTQRKYYKLKVRIISNDELYNVWSEFVNDDLYKSYFETPEEKWYSTFNLVKEYFNKNGKLPPQHNRANDKNITILSNWIGTQKKNYIPETRIMSNNEIYNTWTDFMRDK